MTTAKPEPDSLEDILREMRDPPGWTIPTTEMRMKLVMLTLPKAQLLGWVARLESLRGAPEGGEATCNRVPVRLPGQPDVHSTASSNEGVSPAPSLREA